MRCRDALRYQTHLRIEMIPLLSTIREWIAGSLTCNDKFDALVDALSEALCCLRIHFALVKRSLMPDVWILTRWLMHFIEAEVLADSVPACRYAAMR